MQNGNNIIKEVEQDRNKLLYPNELHNPIFIMGKEYKNLKIDEVGKYIDRSWGNLIVKIRPHHKKPLNYFDNNIFIALLYILLSSDDKKFLYNDKGIHNAVIEIKTSYYQIAKLLKMPDSGQTYKYIKQSLTKFNNTIVDINYKNDKFAFDSFQLIKSFADKENNIIFQFNQLLSKNILGEFEPNYTLLHTNHFIELENKASSILIPYLKTLTFDNKAIKLTTILKYVYGLDDESYNNMTSSNKAKALNNIINALLELINKENKEPIINNIELIIKSPKNESYIIVKK